MAGRIEVIENTLDDGNAHATIMLDGREWLIVTRGDGEDEAAFRAQINEAIERALLEDAPGADDGVATG